MWMGPKVQENVENQNPWVSNPDYALTHAGALRTRQYNTIQSTSGQKRVRARCHKCLREHDTLCSEVRRGRLKLSLTSAPIEMNNWEASDKPASQRKLKISQCCFYPGLDRNARGNRDNKCVVEVGISVGVRQCISLNGVSGDKPLQLWGEHKDILCLFYLVNLFFLNVAKIPYSIDTTIHKRSVAVVHIKI